MERPLCASGHSPFLVFYLSYALFGSGIGADKPHLYLRMQEHAWEAKSFSSPLIEGYQPALGLSNVALGR